MNTDLVPFPGSSRLVLLLSRGCVRQRSAPPLSRSIGAGTAGGVGHERAHSGAPVGSRLTSGSREWSVGERSCGERSPLVSVAALPDRLGGRRSDGTDSDLAERVFYSSPGDYPKPTGRRPVYDFELWQPLATADVMRTCLQGSLPGGCSMTMRHITSPNFDHGLGCVRGAWNPGNSPHGQGTDAAATHGLA